MSFPPTSTAVAANMGRRIRRIVPSFHDVQGRREEGWPRHRVRFEEGVKRRPSKRLGCRPGG